MDAKRLSSLETLTIKAVRQALKDWGSLKSLGASPLVNLKIIRNRLQAVGYPDMVIGSGMALRDVLREAIESLKPVDDLLATAEKKWRPYTVLKEQYINDRSMETVATELCISRSVYFGEQNRALGLLVDIIHQWEVQATIQKPPDNLAMAASTAPQTLFLAPPRPNHDLLGRHLLLTDLKHRLCSTESEPVLALHGLPGVGKTALAVELVHAPEILAHFPDGILWAGLGRQPDILAHLSVWAVSLGLPNQDTQRQVSSVRRAQEIHTAIGMKRMLLVLDDVWELNDALPFRVGGPHCAYLLTTRLASVALDFACEDAIAIQELSAPDSLALLRQIAPQAVQAEPEEAERLSSVAGGLPLALILMGRHLRRQSYGVQTRRLRAALAQLHEAETRLTLAQPQPPLEQHPDLFADTPLSLRAVIGISDTALDADARQTLRILAIFPPKPNTFPESAALAVAGIRPQSVDVLVDYGLVEAISPNRYTLHQSITDYARLDETDPAAHQRFVTYWVDFIRSHAGEYKRLSQELDNLIQALDMAFDRQDYAAFIDGAITLQNFLLQWGLLALADRYLDNARHAARLLADQQRLASVWLRFGILAGRRGQYAEAEKYLLESLALARSFQDLQTAADSLRHLGHVNERRGDFKSAASYCEQAITTYRQSGNRYGEGQAMRILGGTFGGRGEFSQARQYHEQALLIFREVGDLQGESATLNDLAGTYTDTGEPARARVYYEQALPLKRQLGDRWGEAVIYNNLGAVALGQANYVEARICFEQSLKIRCDLGDRRGIGMMLGNLGVTLINLGNYTQGNVNFEEALGIYREIGARQLESRELGFLGLSQYYLGEFETACQSCRHASQIAAEVGSRLYQGNAMTYLGHALAALGHIAESEQAYQQALTLRQEAGQSQLAVDAQAGLARLALDRGNIDKAIQLTEEILAYHAEHTLSGADEPIRVYLTCYQVLQVHRDQRAAEILEIGYHQLLDQAQKINDPEQRRSFMQNIVAHRDFLAAVSRLALA